MGSQRVRHNWVTKHAHTYPLQYSRLENSTEEPGDLWSQRVSHNWVTEHGCTHKHTTHTRTHTHWWKEGKQCQMMPVTERNILQALRNDPAGESVSRVWTQCVCLHSSCCPDHCPSCLGPWSSLRGPRLCPQWAPSVAGRPLPRRVGRRWCQSWAQRIRKRKGQETEGSIAVREWKDHQIPQWAELRSCGRVWEAVRWAQDSP